MINMQIKGLEQALSQLQQYPAEVEQAAEKQLTAAALEFERDLKKNLSKAGTGRTYKRRSVTHRASAPGMPPAVDSGTLRSSIHTVPERLRRTVFTRLKYAKYLEFGTRKMKARPFWFSSFEAFKPRYLERLKRALGLK